MISSVPHTGIPGIASAAAPAENTNAMPTIAPRGGTRSTAESTVNAPTTWANEEPKRLSAASSGEPVVA